MLKRSFVFSNPALLSLRNQQMVIAFKGQPDKTTTVPIEDIGAVVIENQLIHLTIPLINSLAESGVQVVFCNARGMPSSFLQNMDGNNLQGEILQNQMACGEVLKKQLWKQIIESKIKNQAALLRKVGHDGELLKPYYSNVKTGDSDNREGIAARIYFQHLFGADFVRNREENGINALLNYGYSILRAAVSRAIVSSGLFPAFGLHHHNRSNAFPLADDLMEPYRPFVDEIVYKLIIDNQFEITRKSKSELIMLLYADTCCEKVNRPLCIALSMTTASLVKCLSKETNKLLLPSFL